MRIVLSLVLLGIACGQQCITDTSPGFHNFACYSKTFAFNVPSTCTSTPCGLVVDVHGWMMGSNIEDRNTDLRRAGGERGYITLQPQASGNPPFTSWSASDDVDVRSVIIEAIGAFKLDSNKIHFTGFSQGGAMTWRFLCKYPDLFGSIAPTAMDGKDCFQSPETVPSVQLPILYLHGTTDAMVSFSGAIRSRDSLVEGWKMGPGEVISTDPNHIWTRYTNDVGTIFEFLQFDYAANSAIIRGHCFPGSKDLPETPLEPGQTLHFGCLPPNAFVTADILMDFFVRHPKRSGNVTRF